jgi:hypothetical protein
LEFITPDGTNYFSLLRLRRGCARERVSFGIQQPTIRLERPRCFIVIALTSANGENKSDLISGIGSRDAPTKPWSFQSIWAEAVGLAS